MGKKSPEFVKRRTKTRKFKKKIRYYKEQLKERLSDKQKQTSSCIPATVTSEFSLSNKSKDSNQTEPDCIYSTSAQTELSEASLRNTNIKSHQPETKLFTGGYRSKLNHVKSLLRHDKLDPLIMGWKLLNDIKQTEAIIRNQTEVLFDSNWQKKGFL